MKSQLPELIRRRREQLGFSLQDVAEDAEITKAHVWHLEKGKATNPSIQTLAGLDFALDFELGTCALAALGLILDGEIDRVCAE